MTGQQPPAFKAQTEAAMPRWRKMPPAVFPPVLGAFGLATAWGRTVDAFSFTPAVGQILMGAVTLLYLYLLGNYVAKLAKRPGVLGEDLRVLPGRAGLAAMTMAGMLLALAVLPFSMPLAKAILALAVAGHAVIAVMFVWQFLTGPAEARTVTPVMHLTLVGFIVSPLAALQMGWATFSQIVFLFSVLVALAIWIASALQFARQDVPAPLRPLLAIHVAPASLLGTVALLMGNGGLGLAFGILAILMVAALLIRARWVIAGGFSPLWGAFTFPLAAFSSLMMVLGTANMGPRDGLVFDLIGAVALVAATFFIPWVLTKVVQLWLKGQLAVKTNSAVA
ncbi:tellurium resistance protein [Sinisalibacter aestuarii]|uniref:Tellurium resistance protein n=1 Tax=Sinisalibacter aestuarii TaxID=2949426 RepID=A0ABQ5LSS3_9RHOB|nr:tellurium resistance protein [Sinisalibacter aestuarii]GKY88013.1 tellurium resistance protein [Sinisalibacter aestuarii]